MSFELVAECNGARAGVLHTAHGDVETPIFMPVATRAAMRAMEMWQLEEMGAQIILANAYHLFLRPGDELVRDLGGLHQFAGWDRPWLTDSGGFQIFNDALDNGGILKWLGKGQSLAGMHGGMALPKNPGCRAGRFQPVCSDITGNEQHAGSGCLGIFF